MAFITSNLLSEGGISGSTFFSGGTNLLSIINSSSGTFTGGTVSGPTTFTNGLSANTISAATYIVSGISINRDFVVNTNLMFSTGVYEFSGITMGTGNTFNVAPVKAYSFDNTDVTNPIPIFVNYSGGTNVSTPYLLTAPATYITLTTGATLNLLNSEPTESEYRQLVLLGVIGHPSGTLTGIGNRPDIIFDFADQMRDMFRGIRYINDGMTPYANTGLTMAVTAGKLYGLGIGFVANGKNNPTSISVSGSSPTTFQYRTQTGQTFTNTTTISAGTYDVGGVATALPGGVNTSTNQRIFVLVNGNIRVQFGQTSYTSLANAIAGAQNETFTTFSNNRLLGTLIGILSIRKGAADITDIGDARFLPVSKFGETVGAAGGISVGTLQTAYNNSSEPEILTNGLLGALTIKRGSAIDADPILIGQNGSGIGTFGVTGNGDLTVNSITDTTKYTGGSGTTNNSTFGFVHGRNSSAGTANDIIILGPSITGGTSGFTYVNALNIKQVGAGPGTTDIGIDANGNVVNQASDIRLKENISTIENALDKVKNLRGIKYQWKDRNAGGDEFRIGFIAQEVNEVEPLLVTNIGDLLGVQYKDVTALLVEAIKELSSGVTSTTNTYLETQTILAEDNNIELNFNGIQETAIGGGISIINAKPNGESAEFKTDENGDWITNNALKPKELIIPYYTPSATTDTNGSIGSLTRDDDYLYLKNINGWKRTNFENF